MTGDARIAVGIAEHPKMVKLERKLGPAGFKAIVCLFLWAAQNRPTGDLSGMDEDDIEIAARWAGDRGACLAAMVTIGWLDGDAYNYSIHDWEEHNPWAVGAPARTAKAKWNAIKRHHGEQQANLLVPSYRPTTRNAASNATSTIVTGNDASSIAHSTIFDATSNAPSPSPSPVKQSKALSVGNLSQVDSRALATGPSERLSETDPDEPRERPAPTPAGAACLAMLGAGIHRANPHDPRLLELIAAGASTDQFRAAASDAVSRGKPNQGYALGIVRGQMTEAAQIRGSPTPLAKPIPRGMEGVVALEELKTKIMEERRAKRLAADGDSGGNAAPGLAAISQRAGDG